MVKNPPTNTEDAGDMGSIPGLGRSPRGGYTNPLQYSGLGNLFAREVWWATVKWVSKESGSRLSTV